VRFKRLILAVGGALCAFFGAESAVATDCCQYVHYCFDTARHPDLNATGCVAGEGQWEADHYCNAPGEYCEPKGVFVGSIVIRDVKVNLKGVETDVGDITVTLIQNPANPPYAMDATFDIADAYKNLRQWTKFHWFQIVIDDDCPPTFNGLLPAIPYVDPPFKGWDYQRPPGDDDLPWYWNAAEEARKDTIQINRTWDTKGRCKSCSISGTPCSNDVGCPRGEVCSFPIHPGPWMIRFRTWLVAETATTRQFSLIAGFEWARRDTGWVGPVDLAPLTQEHVDQAETALKNAGFLERGAEWSVNRQCSIENCFAVCKDGTGGGTFGKTQLECHSQCDVICGDNAAVALCVFKDEVLKLPTVSVWGAVVMALLMVTGVAVKFGRRRRRERSGRVRRVAGFEGRGEDRSSRIES